MQASNKTLHELYEGQQYRSATFQIPPFQRPYKWDKKDWEQLYNDISGNTGHFIGSMVVVPAGNQQNAANGAQAQQQGNQPNVMEVIDGQQRLTTLFILAWAARQRFGYFLQQKQQNNQLDRQEQDAANDCDGALRAILGVNKEVGKKRLTLSTQNHNEEDLTYLHQCNNGNNPEKPAYYQARKIDKCHQYFTNKINEDIQTYEDAKAFCEKIYTLQLVIIRADNHGQAVALFECLNNRGVPLTIMEVLKNNFVARHNGDEEKIKQWENMSDALTANSSQTPERFLRHYYSAKQLNNLARGDIINTYQGNNGLFGGNNFAKDFFNKATIYSNLLVNAFDTKDNDNEAAYDKRYLVYLNHIGFAPSYQLLLFLKSNYNDVDVEQSIAKLLVQIAIRRHLGGKPNTRGLDNIFISVMKSIQQMQNPVTTEDVRLSIAQIFRQNGLAEIADIQDILSGAMYEENAGLTRDLLAILQLESETNVGNGFSHDLYKQHSKGFQFTVEHIAPQNPRGDNRADWVNMMDENTYEDYASWGHSLGNLTLTTYNSKLSDKPYGDKISTIHTHHLTLNQEVQANDKWTLEIVEARTERLVSALIGFLHIPEIDGAQQAVQQAA